MRTHLTWKEWIIFTMDENELRGQTEEKNILSRKSPSTITNFMEGLKQGWDQRNSGRQLSYQTNHALIRHRSQNMVGQIMTQLWRTIS